MKTKSLCVYLLIFKDALMFSVITINYNNIAGLERTVKSVLSQKFENFEYIVVDGASTDGSKIFLDSIIDRKLNYISEADLGIYDALNKGIKLAQRDYIAFMLNSGDMLDNKRLKFLF